MSALPSQFETAHGALVPLNPDESPDRLAQERAEEKINAPRLLKYLNKTLDAIASLDQNDNLKIHNEMTRCVAYYDGRWDGQVRNGVWVDNAPVTGEIQPKDNEYKKQIDKLQMEMCRGRIEYHPEAVNKFSAEMREAAQFAERRIEVNQERIETEPFIQAENMSLLLKTVSYRYTFFDRNAESQEKSVELNVMKHLTQGASATVCRTCDRTSQGGQCPYCGDTETKEISSPQSEGMKTEQETKSAGRVVTVRPDATMVQLDLNARDIQSSSFVRWRLVLRRCDWEAFFPDTTIPSSNESQEARHKAEAQNQPSNSDWAMSSDAGGGDQFEKIEGELVWLDPKVYQRYENKENETLGNGQDLPVGAKLIAQFPSGVCVARIGQKVLDLYPSNKNKCWTMCVYGLREHALHGSGTTALLGPQDTINDENAFIVAHHYYMAAGREFVRSGAIEGGDLPPYNKVGIISNAPDDHDAMSWAYGRSQPAALSADVYGFRSEMKGSLQDAAGTSSLSMQGAADVKALGTATGVEASRDQAVGRMIPNRKLQAWAGCEWIKQALELERENYTAETFLEMAEKADEKGEIEYTERGVRAFFESDVCSDFMIKPVDGSWMPTTPAQEKANAAGFAQAASQLKDNPQMISVIAPAFGQDYSIDEWGAAQRNASMRLEEYARVSEVVSQGGYPPSPEMVQVVMTNTAEWARVNPVMDDHPAMINFYTDWWMSDEGRNADSLLRMVVQSVFALHKQGVIAQAQEIASAAQSAMPAPPPPPPARPSESMSYKDAPEDIKRQMEMAEGYQPSQIAATDTHAETTLGEHAVTLADREHQAQIDTEKRQHEAEIQAGLKDHEAQTQADLITHKAVVEAATRPHETAAQMALKEHSAVVDAATRPPEQPKAT